MHVRVLVLLPILAAAACSPIPLKEVEQEAPPKISRETDLAPVLLEKLQFQLRRGTTIGRYYGAGLVCHAPFGDITWGSGRYTTRDVEFADLFYEELEASGFDVVGNPNRLFDRDEDILRAEYRIGGQVLDLKLNICNKVNFFTGWPTGSSGDGYVRVRWQVYSNAERRVVYTTETEGRGETSNAVPDGGLVVLNNAFASAVANLSADDGFQDTLQRQTDTSPADGDWLADAEEKVAFRRLDPFQDPITENVDHVRSATVTVSGGVGHGSGFFISGNGLLVTNNHVVGDAKFVKVQLISGREVMGEVLRRHAKRDVALVLVEGRGYPALPVRKTPAKVTEEVYAVGTPRLRDLSTTVSKGVVSAIRTRRTDGLEYIQADVDTHGGNSGGPLVDANGNLVGITVAGFMAAGDTTKSSVGLNMFIPIDRGLAALGLQQADLPRSYSAIKKLRAAPDSGTTD